MSNVSNIATSAVEELTVERESLMAEVERIDAVLAAFGDLATNGDAPKAKSSKTTKRPLAGAAKAAAERKAAREASEKKGSRRSRVTNAKGSTKKASKSDESRGDQIMRLTKQGMGAREIADELGTHVGYVYTVRRKHGA